MEAISTRQCHPSLPVPAQMTQRLCMSHVSFNLKTYQAFGVIFWDSWHISKWEGEVCCHFVSNSQLTLEWTAYQHHANKHSNFIKTSDEQRQENIANIETIKDSYLFIFIEQVQLCVHLTNSAPSINGNLVLNKGSLRQMGESSNKEVRGTTAAVTYLIAAISLLFI